MTETMEPMPESEDYKRARLEQLREGGWDRVPGHAEEAARLARETQTTDDTAERVEPTDPIVTAHAWPCDGCGGWVTDGAVLGNRQLCEACFQKEARDW